jgi:RimJ/RimL family protein N-acetyltransferase
MRPYQISDARDAYRWLGDIAVMQYMANGPDKSEADTVARLKRYAASQQKYGFSKWIVFEKSTNLYVGDAGITIWDETGEPELGYRFARSHWGKGLATEAARAWLEYGFRELNQTRIVAFVHTDNRPSIRVIDKLGFRYCRNDRLGKTECLVYEILRPASDSR